MSAPSPTAPCRLAVAARRSDRLSTRARRYRQALDSSIASAAARGRTVDDLATHEAKAADLAAQAAAARAEAETLAGGAAKLTRAPRGRTRVLFVRMTDAEHAAWKSRAATAGMSAADLARIVLVRATPNIAPKLVERPAQVDAECVRHWRAVAQLMNQVAMRVHVAVATSHPLGEHVVHDMVAVVEMMRRAADRLDAGDLAGARAATAGLAS